MQYLLFSVDRERENTLRTNNTHARNAYKNVLCILVNIILIIASHILFVVDRD